MILEADLWAAARQNLSLPGEFSTRSGSKKAYSSSEMSWNLEISPVASLAIIISSERITKVLIRLRGCAGWSVPSLFATQEDRVSHVEAHLSLTMYEAFLI